MRASRSRRGRPVDRPAVVRVDQRVLEEIGALVDVGHTGARELHELLAERVRPARAADPGHELLDLGHQLGVGEHRGGPRRDRVVHLGNGLDVAGDELGLLRRLREVARHPVDRDRPCADEVLPRQQLQRAARAAGAGPTSGARSRSTPGASRRAPRGGRGRPRSVWCRGWTAWSWWRAGPPPARRARRGTRRGRRRTGRARRRPR